MPELPEIETTRRALERRLLGVAIERCTQHRADLRFPLPPQLPERLRGRRLEALRRRAKYLLADLDDGETLVLHLGMSGRLVFDGPALGAHEHLTLGFADGTILRLHDPRRFGMVDLAPTAGLAAHARFRHLGLEPLDPGFDGARLATALAGRTTPLKVALMDQRVVVGIGNIYASEALHRARLSPRRRAGWLKPAHGARLAGAVRAVLQEAIEAGGSSLKDYVQASGELGNFQRHFRVYDRAGERCACGRA
ncbi:MAG: bifunctional DNA-formamidopyrimidine glycosylase/DNA-(apurinic or apyrimidinic site) lyase, partial [Alphaproteobacteria bacterium]